jgi:hypothetical protein
MGATDPASNIFYERCDWRTVRTKTRECRVATNAWGQCCHTDVTSTPEGSLKGFAPCDTAFNITTGLGYHFTGTTNTMTGWVLD